MNIPTLSPALELDIITSIINAVGRDVILTSVQSRGLCPVCSGNDPFCPVCGGNATSDTTANTTVRANIVWKGSDAKLYRPEGQFVEGDCLIDFVLITSFTITDALLKRALSVTVDERICTIKRWYYEGSPINRVTLVLTQDDDLGGQRIG